MVETAPDPAVDVAPTLRRAVGLLATDPAKAEAVAREALAAATGNPDALIVLGTALRQQGAFEAAREALEPVAQAQPSSWIAQFELARVLLALGRSRAALDPLSRALALNVGLAAGWRLLGDISMFAGQFSAAQSAYDRQLRAILRDPRLQGPADALIQGRLDAAERDLRSLLARESTAVAAMHLLGEVLARRGRLVEAEAILAQCLRASPDFDMARQAHALVLLRSGKGKEALAEVDALLARDPDDSRARMTRAATLTQIGDFAGAAEVTASLLEAFPDQAHGWLVHGAGLRTLGRIDEAIAAYRRCIELDPDCSAAWWGLANLKTYRFSDEARAAIGARLARPNLAAHDRANLHFTLGKAHEDAGHWVEAIDNYALGNAVAREQRPYDPEATSAFVQRAKALFTPAFFEDRNGWGTREPDPIFIVGLPRSGSTLVDQILASHPQVEALGELIDLRVIADWIGGPGSSGKPSGYPGRLASLTFDVCAKLGRDYLDWTRARRRSGRPRFTDKAPENFLHVGLIDLILPGARIIDVRRHPLACGLSAFTQHFESGWDFSYDLSDIGRYYAGYVELMAHFDDVLPGRVHRLFYEALVNDTEAEVRRLLDHLGLPFDAACLRFFENPRAVATPSSQQVRQPIFTDAIDHWRAFEPWLGPLKAALGPVLEAYPAAPAFTPRRRGDR